MIVRRTSSANNGQLSTIARCASTTTWTVVRYNTLTPTRRCTDRPGCLPDRRVPFPSRAPRAAPPGAGCRDRLRSTEHTIAFERVQELATHVCDLGASRWTFGISQTGLRTPCGDVDAEQWAGNGSTGAGSARQVPTARARARRPGRLPSSSLRPRSHRSPCPPSGCRRRSSPRRCKCSGPRSPCTCSSSRHSSRMRRPRPPACRP
jgi:hypothetical protein